MTEPSEPQIKNGLQRFKEKARPYYDRLVAPVIAKMKVQMAAAEQSTKTTPAVKKVEIKSVDTTRTSFARLLLVAVLPAMLMAFVLYMMRSCEPADPSLAEPFVNMRSIEGIQLNK